MFSFLPIFLIASTCYSLRLERLNSGQSLANEFISIFIYLYISIFQQLLIWK